MKVESGAKLMIYKITTKDFKGESRTVRAKLDDELKAHIPPEGLKVTAPIAVGINKKVELTYTVSEEGAIVSFQLDKENDKFSIAEVIIQFAKDIILWKKVS